MKKNVKVDIPYSRPDDLIEVAEKMVTKDTELGEASQLRILDSVPFKKNLADAKSYRAEARSLHEKAEGLNQKANLCLGLDPAQNSSTPGTVYCYVVSAKNILEGYYNGQEKMLQEWGLGVTITEGSPKAKAKAKAAAK
jgi:hypothetical protein